MPMLFNFEGMKGFNGMNEFNIEGQLQLDLTYPFLEIVGLANFVVFAGL